MTLSLQKGGTSHIRLLVHSLGYSGVFVNNNHPGNAVFTFLLARKLWRIYWRATHRKSWRSFNQVIVLLCLNTCCFFNKHNAYNSCLILSFILHSSLIWKFDMLIKKSIYEKHWTQIQLAQAQYIAVPLAWKLKTLTSLWQILLISSKHHCGHRENLRKSRKLVSQNIYREGMNFCRFCNNKKQVPTKCHH